MHLTKKVALLKILNRKNVFSVCLQIIELSFRRNIFVSFIMGFFHSPGIHILGTAQAIFDRCDILWWSFLCHHQKADILEAAAAAEKEEEEYYWA